MDVCLLFLLCVVSSGICDGQIVHSRALPGVCLLCVTQKTPTVRRSRPELRCRATEKNMKVCSDKIQAQLLPYIGGTTFMSQHGEEGYPDEGCRNTNEIKDNLIHKETTETNGLLASLNTTGHMQCDGDT